MVEWLKDLPKSEREPVQRKYDWYGIAAELRKHPGEWAIVARDAPRTHAALIRAGKYKAFSPAEHYLVTTHGPAGNRNRADLIMAYIGTPGARMVAEQRHPRRPAEDSDD